jgi:hypothetical protein
MMISLEDEKKRKTQAFRGQHPSTEKPKQVGPLFAFPNPPIACPSPPPSKLAGLSIEQLQNFWRSRGQRT